MIPLSWASLWDVGLLAGFYAMFLYPRYQKKGTNQLILHSVFYVYLCLVMLVTLMPIFTSLPHLFAQNELVIHLNPFEDVILGHLDAEKQVILNVLLLVPFGFLLPQIKEIKGWQIITTTFLLSISIELVQPLLNSMRSCDITDVITNTFGGLVGYVLYCLFQRMKNLF